MELKFEQQLPYLRVNHPAFQGVSTGWFGTIVNLSDDADQSALDAVQAAVEGYDAFITDRQAQEETQAQAKAAAATLVASAADLAPYVAYFATLQANIRQSVAQRNDLDTHYALLLTQLQADANQWGDFLHLLELTTGLTNADLSVNKPESAATSTKRSVALVASLFVTTGALVGLLPYMGKR